MQCQSHRTHPPDLSRLALHFIHAQSHFIVLGTRGQGRTNTPLAKELNREAISCLFVMSAYINNPALKTRNDCFAGNLGYETTEEHLLEMFSRVGPVKKVRLQTDKESGRSKGFAFIE